MSLIRKQIPGRGWQTVEDLDAGGAEHVYRLTAGPDVFEVEQVIDFGGPAVWTMIMSDLVVVPDGEVFNAGSPDPEVEGELVVAFDGLEFSLDGVTWVSVVTNAPFFSFTNHAGNEETTAFAYAGYSNRYLKIPSFSIADSHTFEPYAGANHPTATATFTFTT